MSGASPVVPTSELSFELLLQHNGDVADTAPEFAMLVCDDGMLIQMCAALVSVGLMSSMGAPQPEITIGLDGCFLRGDEWVDGADGAFRPASYWLEVRATTIAVEVWDQHSADTLYGVLYLSDVPSLADALRAMHAAISQQFVSVLVEDAAEKR